LNISLRRCRERSFTFPRTPGLDRYTETTRPAYLPHLCLEFLHVCCDNHRGFVGETKLADAPLWSLSECQSCTNVQGNNERTHPHFTRESVIGPQSPIIFSNKGSHRPYALILSQPSKATTDPVLQSFRNRPRQQRKDRSVLCDKEIERAYMITSDEGGW
jgi:hypothetical protein